MRSTGYILNGEYHTGEPPVEGMKDPRASTDKQHDHDRQRREHRRDLIQPYKNGLPNREFIEQYPDEAKQYGFVKE